MTRVKVKIVMRTVLTLAMVAGVRAQFEEEEETFRGQLIGSLNSYHHQVNAFLFHGKIGKLCMQVSGDIYAVDDETLMLHNFVYDGNGKDTFFWAGSSNRPSSKGYIVPDKNGRTNVLSR